MMLRLIVAGLWGLWVVSWFIAGVFAAPVKSRPDRGQEIRYQVLTYAGAGLIFAAYAVFRDTSVLYEPGATLLWVCIGSQVIGLAFTWWARVHLGALWSVSVTRKHDHRVVESGPYAIVRHPIYTGLLLALLATAVAKGSVIAFAGFGLFAVSFVIKARLEERFLREELGPQYDAYAARVPMLVPFMSGGGARLSR